MFDIGMSELLLIGIVALIVVGPKDLPGMFRTLGRFTAKARALGREFTRAMNDAADESGLKGAADGLKAVSNPKKFGLDALNDAASKFEKWDPTKPSGKAKTDDPKIAEPKPVDPERASDTAKIREATERAGRTRLEREKAEKAAAEAAPEAKTPAKSAPKPAAKRTTKSSGATGTTKPAAKLAAKAPAKPATKAPAKATAKKAAKPAATKPTAAKPAPKKKTPAKKAASE